MSTLFGGSGPSPSDAPIKSLDDLQLVMRAGEKPPERFGLGIEYERLPVERSTGRAVPYGPPGPSGGSPTIETLLETLARERGWQAEREAGRIIALDRGGTRLTLEPGAQVELSGRVHVSLDDARAEICSFVREVDETAMPMGIAFLAVGSHPFTEFTEIGWVPKGRYRIMAPYLAGKGHLAHTMMKATAGCQLNFDYSDEADAMEKLRVAMGISSIVTAMCAHSPLSRGQANGFLSRRSHIWLHTDPDRCGLLPVAFEEGTGYGSYIDYALDVPMLFVVRDGRWIDMTPRTFRSYLKGGGASGLTPTRGDWELHLTTLFPEVRLKSWLEVRGSDSGSPGMILAQAALWKGILYDAGARRDASNLVDGIPFDERARFHREVVRSGLKAQLNGVSAGELAIALVGLAERGLTPGDAAHLEPLRSIARSGVTPAERLLSRWSGEWRRDHRRLIAELAPDPTLRPA